MLYANNRTVRACGLLASAIAASLVASVPAIADSSKAIHETGISESLLEAREAKHSPVLNMLTYQHMDDLFGTQNVPAGSPAPLAKGEMWSNDKFEFELDGTAFSMNEALELLRINSIVILRNGEMVYETYRNGTDASTRSTVYSISKSVMAVLVGIALEKGIIASIDDPVDTYLPELAESAYSGVSIKHLLTMQSGTSWKEIYTPGSQLSLHRDRSLHRQEVYYEDYAREIQKAGEPGRNFEYSTLDTCVVGWLLDEVLDGQLAQFMSDNLWTPAGMETDAYWLEQGPVNAPRPFYGAGLATSTRDMARFGQLMLNGGSMNGVDIVSRDWVETISTPQGGLNHYGYFWWIMPKGAYAALGVNGQVIYVDPQSETVVAIHAYWPEMVSKERSATRQQFLSSIIAMSSTDQP